MAEWPPPFVLCQRCTMRFEVARPQQGEHYRCPEPGCGRRFWASQRDGGHPKANRVRVGILPEYAT